MADIFTKMVRQNEQVTVDMNRDEFDLAEKEEQ